MNHSRADDGVLGIQRGRMLPDNDLGQMPVILVHHESCGGTQLWWLDSACLDACSQCQLLRSHVGVGVQPGGYFRALWSEDGSIQYHICSSKVPRTTASQSHAHSMLRSICCPGSKHTICRLIQKRSSESPASGCGGSLLDADMLSEKLLDPCRMSATAWGEQLASMDVCDIPTTLLVLYLLKALSALRLHLPC